ncbi:hypothetical protein DWQ65_12375 [Treponema phagedenis]|uniref:Uncharacterized protein n=1 Tax=Treponema phagedenis TaxID=162 RepID=A0A0B7H0L2_TREPH|nr:hypothetical protein HMPREF9554_00127 [Treponema phagedenis F0421]QSH95554.1 hypothetical protein C5O78_11130 [Treponema phagedenis]QSI00840.1 hypothetical protein DWQ65_12375 [Treponema phagedenis]CEM62785.1 conserved hypothetical protein [Treponema phagedenis]
MLNLQAGIADAPISIPGTLYTEVYTNNVLIEHLFLSINFLENGGIFLLFSVLFYTKTDFFFFSIVYFQKGGTLNKYVEIILISIFYELFF